MKAFTLGVDSWHFKIVNFGEKRISPSWGDTDICEYTRCFLKGLFWFCVAGMMITVGAVFVLGSLANIFSAIFLGYILEPYSFAFIIIVGSLCTAIGITWLVELHRERVRQRYQKMRELQSRDDYVEPEPGFLTLAYRKFKDKTCVRIKLEKTND